MPSANDDKRPTGRTQRPKILVVDADAATQGLIQEWLTEHGCDVVAGTSATRAPEAPFDLALVDVPFPKNDGCARIHDVSEAHPDTPIVAMSPTFFSSVECQGHVARALNVAGVLPKPVRRDALIAAVDRLLGTVSPR
jgi:CheY-like chemotaxis protein